MAHTDKSTPGPATARGFLRLKPPPEAACPAGEGEKTLSWERVARRSRDGCGAVPGRTRCRPYVAFRSSGVTVAVRLFPLIRHGLCPCHLPRGGRRPPAGDKTLPCLERVDRAQPGTGVEGTPESSNRARSNILGVPSTSAAAAAPSPSRRRQGLLSFRDAIELT